MERLQSSQWVGTNEKRGDIYREGAGDGVKAYVDLVNKVCRIADAHERAARVDIVLPTIQLFVVLEREVETLVLRFEEQTIGLKVGPFYVGDISKVDGHRRGAGLERMEV